MALSSFRISRCIAMLRPILACGIALLLFGLHTAACAGPGKQKECVPDDKHPCPQKNAPPPRRAVPLVIERTPPVAPAARTGVPVVVPPINMPAPPPTVSGCDAGGCRDSAGNRYDGGNNGVYLNDSGRQCQRVGTTMQCF